MVAGYSRPRLGLDVKIVTYGTCDAFGIEDLEMRRSWHLTALNVWSAQSSGSVSGMAESASSGAASLGPRTVAAMPAWCSTIGTSVPAPNSKKLHRETRTGGDDGPFEDRGPVLTLSDCLFNAGQWSADPPCCDHPVGASIGARRRRRGAKFATAGLRLFRGSLQLLPADRGRLSVRLRHPVPGPASGHCQGQGIVRVRAASRRCQLSA